MCGRYTLFRLDQLLKNFPGLSLPSDMNPRYNIAPTNGILAIPNNHPDHLELFHWGLIPSWAKEPSIGARMINARAETLDEKPAFRAALQRRRCLIPTDGFYEWRKEGGGHKTPMHIRLKSGDLFAFAGLWDVWRSPEGQVVPSVTIVTTAPNDLLAPIHNRMPAIVRREDYATWLAPDPVPGDAMKPLLRPYPSDEMFAQPVSPLVNKPGNDHARCVEPAETGLLF